MSTRNPPEAGCPLCDHVEAGVLLGFNHLFKQHNEWALGVQVEDLWHVYKHSVNAGNNWAELYTMIARERAKPNPPDAETTYGFNSSHDFNRAYQDIWTSDISSKQQLKDITRQQLVAATGKTLDDLIKRQFAAQQSALTTKDKPE